MNGVSVLIVMGMVTSADGLAWRKAAEYVLSPRVLSLAVKKGDDAYCVFVPIGPSDFAP